MHALALLKADHQWILALFVHYEAASHPDTKRTLAAQVFVELESHEQLEAHVFDPLVHETDEGPALVQASLHAHQTMTQLMQELRGMAQYTHEFDTKFHALRHNVEHHVEEEEAEMFPLARERHCTLNQRATIVGVGDPTQGMCGSIGIVMLEEHNEALEREK
jgi:hypothetical protein